MQAPGMAFTSDQFYNFLWDLTFTLHQYGLSRSIHLFWRSRCGLEFFFKKWDGWGTVTEEDRLSLNIRPMFKDPINAWKSVHKTHWGRIGGHLCDLMSYFMFYKNFVLIIIVLKTTIIYICFCGSKPFVLYSWRYHNILAYTAVYLSYWIKI